MAVTYNASLKNTRMVAVQTAIDAGAGFATLEIGTAGMAAVLATITFPDPASSVTADVLTFLGVPLGVTASGTGAAAAARVKDPSGTVVVSGLTVGTSGTDIIISSTAISAGDTVTMTAGTITHG